MADDPSPSGSAHDLGGDLFSGGYEFPRLVLRWDDLLHNIRVFHDYCERHGAVIAPHGKTTLSPEIFRAQLDGGAWGITVATAAQARVARSAGATRILVANEVIGIAEMRTLAEIAGGRETEIISFVDSPEAVRCASRGAASAQLATPSSVLVEIGFRGGRAGVRDRASLEATLDAARAEGSGLVVRGFAAYEGIISAPDPKEEVSAVDAFLEHVAEIAQDFRDRIDDPRPIVSAGGSVFVDRVLEILGPARLPGWLLVVRSGGYVTHDSGYYTRMSPLSATSARYLGGDALRPALELWAAVLSRPEPELAILGLGHRDSPARLDLPIPFARHTADGAMAHLDDHVRVRAMNDHHAYLEVPERLALDVGDHVGLGISHPCEAFERWRSILTVDADRRVIGKVHTEFS